MSNAPTNVSDYDAIAKAVQHYIDGAKSGRGDDMKPAFHKDATIFGYAGADLFAGPIQQLFAWNDENGPATGLQARIASIDLIDTVATVRLELDNWTRSRCVASIRLSGLDRKHLDSRFSPGHGFAYEDERSRYRRGVHYNVLLR